MVVVCRPEDVPPSPKLVVEGRRDRKLKSVKSGELTVKSTEMEKETVENWMNCRTPTAKQYRIPDVMTCPPAPKKRRMYPQSVRVRQYFDLPMNLDEIFKKISTAK